jgi:hypothetical protein
MDKLFRDAAMAWNPVGQVRRRLEAGNLSLLSVLAPFIGIVVACNLIAVGGQRFFWARVLNALGTEMPANSLMDSDYALRALSTIGVLAPLGAAALLPRAVFDPPGRGPTLATMLIVAAASAFYGAAISVPIYISGGMLATTNVELALRVYTTLGFVAGLANALLTLAFWLRSTHYVLGLRGTQVAVITGAAVLAMGLLVAVSLSSLSAST